MHASTRARPTCAVAKVDARQHGREVGRARHERSVPGLRRLRFRSRFSKPPCAASMSHAAGRGRSQLRSQLTVPPA